MDEEGGENGIVDRKESVVHYNISQHDLLMMSWKCCCSDGLRSIPTFLRYSLRFRLLGLPSSSDAPLSKREVEQEMRYVLERQETGELLERENHKQSMCLEW